MSETRFEIQVRFNNINELLDTYDYDPISLQYQISDINEIDQRKSSYSKTIKIPLTKHNRKVLGDITSLAIDSAIDPNLKAKCWIMVNTIVVMEGNLQLLGATLDDIQNKEEIEIIVYSESDDLFKNIGEKYITDLNLTRYNHIYGTPSQMASWTATASWANTGYYYGMVDYGSDWSINTINDPTTNSLFALYPHHFKPSIYVKNIFNQIFTDAGYTYQSSFLNSLEFENLLIPFTKDGMMPSYFDKIYEEFTAVQSTQTQYTTNGFYGNSTGVVVIPADFEVEDLGNRYDNVTYTYTADIDCSLIFTSQMTWTPYNYGGNSNGGVMYSYIYKNSVLIQTGSYTNTIVEFGTAISHVYTFSPLTLAPGDTIQIKYKYSIIYNGVLPVAGLGLVYIDGTGGTWVRNTLSETVLGTTVYISGCLPSSVKQKDFVMNIVKMFNLYIEPSKEWNNCLIIEPRDDYYENGVIENWTKKIDLLSPIEEQILSNTQYRTIKFSYKEDKDWFNSDYTDLAGGDIYGQYREELTNEFIQDQKKIDITFSPTPLVNITDAYEFVIPKIVKLDNAQQIKPTSANIRILQKNSAGLLSLVASDYWRYNNTWMTSYPYMGHFDNPFNPSNDINFGQVIGLWYEDQDVTNANLVTNYWRKQLDEFNDKDSKIITVEMYLTPTDIYNFKFNKKIFLDIKGNGQYYRVLSITNYDPGKIQPCTVELLKVKDITVPIITTKVVKLVGAGRPVGSVVTAGPANDILGPMNITVGIGNTVSGVTNNVTGKNNVVNGMKIINVGDNNTITGDNISVFGDNITATTSNSFIVDQDYINLTGDIITINGTLSGSFSMPSMNLETVLSNGNDSGTYSIVMGTATHIGSANGGGQLRLDDNVNVVQITTDAGVGIQSMLYMDPTSAQLNSSASYIILGPNHNIRLDTGTGSIVANSDISMDPGKVIKSGNGTASLQLDYGSTPNTVFLSSDTSGNETFIYLDPNTAQLASVGARVSSTTNNIYMTSDAGAEVLCDSVGNVAIYTSPLDSSIKFVGPTPVYGVSGLVHKQAELQTSGAITSTIATITMDKNVCMTLKVRVNGYDQTTKDTIGGEYFAVYRWDTTLGIVVVNTVDKMTEKSTFTNVVTVDIVYTTGYDIEIQVTGDTGYDINWVVSYEYMISQ